MSAIAFSRFRDEVLALYQPPHRRKATWFKMRKVLLEFGDLPAVRRTSDITPSAILLWLAAHTDRRPITNRSYLNTFRAAVNIAVKMQYLRVSPWAIRTDWIVFDDLEDDPDELPGRHHSIEELVAILAQADADAICGNWHSMRDQALVYVYAYTGLRKLEALGLKLADVHLDKELIYLRGRRARRLKTKSSRRPVGIAPELRVVLERWIPNCESEWLFPGSRRKSPWLHGSPGKKPLDRLKALGLRAGVPDVTIQSFRRSLATHSKRFGMGELEIRDLLGHTTVRTQEWYLEDDAENIREAARKISFRQFDSARSVLSAAPVN